MRSNQLSYSPEAVSIVSLKVQRRKFEKPISCASGADGVSGGGDGGLRRCIRGVASPAELRGTFLCGLESSDTRLS